MSPAADRNLLFAVLSLQNEIVPYQAVLASLRTCEADGRLAIADILQTTYGLHPDDRKLIDAMINRQIARHGDISKGLAALEAPSAKEILKTVADTEVTVSMSPDGLGPADSPRTAPREGMRYRILRPHAKGGLGEVFVATDMELNREVALKEIQARHADHENSRGRFVLEAEITGGLEHPGIVPVYGLGSYADGRPYYAMRFIRGENLDQAVKQFHSKTPDFASLEFRQLLGRFVDVCNAIAYAHSRGVLHRDLKPGNIMLGKYGETLVVDWGLAKLLGDQESRESKRPEDDSPLNPATGSQVQETMAGSALGTPGYMSPEQAHGKVSQLGPATDIYSLGATLYALMLNKAPTHGGTMMDAVSRAARGEWTPPRQVNANVPPPLDAICRKAMELDPKDRYADTRALADDVEQFLADEPVAAYTEPLSVRARRWARKHRTLVTTSAAALLLAAVGLGTGLVFVNAEKNRTETQRSLAVANERKAEDAREKAVSSAQAESAAKRVAEARLAQVAKSNEILGSIFESLDPKVIAAAERPLQAILVEKIDKAVALLDGDAVGASLVMADMQNKLGMSLLGLGEPAKALVPLGKALAAWRANLGAEHVDTLVGMNNVAAAYQDDKKPDRALPLYEEALRGNLAKFGPDHGNTLRSMNNLAQCHRVMGKTALAIPFFEEAFERSVARFGPDHASTLRTMNNLADAYRFAGRIEKAVPMFESAVILFKSKLGPDHPDTVTLVNNLAGAYRATGQVERAVPLFEEVLKARRAKLGPDHPDTIGSLGSLGNAYCGARQGAKAVPVLTEFVAGQRKRLAGNPSSFCGTLHNVSSDLLNAAEPAAAETMLRECLAAIEKSKIAGWRVFETRALLGAALLAQGKHAEAEPALLAGYEGLKKREATIPPANRNAIRDAVGWLIELCKATGRDAESKDWRLRLPTEILPVPKG